MRARTFEIKAFKIYMYTYIFAQPKPGAEKISSSTSVFCSLRTSTRELAGKRNGGKKKEGE